MKCLDIHHIGIWVDDMDEMIAFLTETLGLRLAIREQRGAVGSGERALFDAGGNQSIEILTEPDVQLSCNGTERVDRSFCIFPP